MTATLSPSDLGELKTKQQATWASGNYAVIGTTLQIMGESLCEAVDIAAGSMTRFSYTHSSTCAARKGFIPYSTHHSFSESGVCSKM